MLGQMRGVDLCTPLEIARYRDTDPARKTV